MLDQMEALVNVIKVRDAAQGKIWNETAGALLPVFQGEPLQLDFCQGLLSAA